MSIVYFTLFFINILIISGLPVKGTDCSAELQAAQVQCDPFLEEIEGFMEENEGSEPSIEAMSNMTELFQRVSNCYSNFNCTQAIQYKKKLDEEFLENTFSMVGINNCMLELYGAIYEGGYNCTKDYNWFSKDPRIRKDAFSSGKSCFLEIAGNDCRNITVNYLEANYDSFLDILTTTPDGTECKGLYYELDDLKCNQPVQMIPLQLAKFWEKMLPEELKGRDEYPEMFEFFDGDHTNMTLICSVLKDCLENACSFKKRGLDREMIGQVCNQFAKVDNINEEFFDCVYKTHDVTKATCSDDQGSEDILFDKECSRKVMAEKCPESAMVHFDGHWNFALDIFKNGFGDMKKKSNDDAADLLSRT